MLSTNTSGQTFPGLTLKAWAVVNAAGTLIKGFNVTSSSMVTGTCTVNFTTAMATTTYMGKIQAQGKPGGFPAAAQNFVDNGRATGSCAFKIYDSSGAIVNMDVYAEFWE